MGLLDELEARRRPLDIELNLAWWALNTDASADNERRREAAELRYRELLGDAGTFADVARALEASSPGTAEHRGLTRAHAAMLVNQLDEPTRTRLVELETGVESRFTSHRGEIDGVPVDDNAIHAVLGTSGDPAHRRAAWEASKSIGTVITDRVIDLVRLRNESARALGRRDYYALALEASELDEARLERTLDEVEQLTEAPFRRWKASQDAARAARFGCDVADLRPWHYDDPFFQEAPAGEGVDLDAPLAGADIEALTIRTYDGLGIDLRDVLARSDLYSRPGKSQHAFCVDVDRAGDVRVLCNVVPGERWMETMLHEFGHAAYDVGIAGDVRWSLHEAAHMLATEAVAMLLGRLTREPRWWAAVAGVAPPDLGALTAAVADSRRASGLVFARWALVMCHFERQLYRDPDGDHATRWWDLVERFQLVRRPEGRHEPDWAAKIHLAVAPVYYQNYLYGELLASQLQAALDRDAGGLVDRPAAGAWLRDRVFAPGASLRWDALVAAATGEPLTARHFATEISG